MAAGGNALYYMCSFTMGNFTYLYRCRIADQYCCGHACCYKQTPDEPQNIFASWYFWSLILVVLIVFGCIIVSFALSSLKQRHDIESWGMFAGTAFNHLATTITGKHGIIQPRLHYQKRKKASSESTATTAPTTEVVSTQHSQAQGHIMQRPDTAGALSQVTINWDQARSNSATQMPEVGASEEVIHNPRGSAIELQSRTIAD